MVAVIGVPGRLKVRHKPLNGMGYGRRRAGFAFGKDPVELTREDLGDGLEAFERFLAIVEDPVLKCSVVIDEVEHPIGDEELAQIRDAAIAAGARVNPAAPPTADAAEALATGRGALDLINDRSDLDAKLEQLLKDRVQLDEDRRIFVLGKEQLEKDLLAIEAARAQLAEDQQAFEDATAKAGEGAGGAANNAPADAEPAAEVKPQSTAARKPATTPGKPKGSKD